VAFLTAKTFDFGHGESGHAAGGQRLTDFFELEWFDNRSNLFSFCNPCLSTKFIGNRITPILAKTAMGHANSHWRLATFVFVESNQTGNLRSPHLARHACGDDFIGALVVFHRTRHDLIQYFVGR
jgi:hypothetical protein